MIYIYIYMIYIYMIYIYDIYIYIYIDIYMNPTNELTLLTNSRYSAYYKYIYIYIYIYTALILH